MPIVFAHTPRLRLRTATYFGVIDDVTILRAYRGVVADYDSTLDNLIDLSGITSVQLSPEISTQLGEVCAPIFTTAPSSRLAIVAGVSSTPDVTRLLERLHPHIELRECATLEDALIWLGHATPPA